MGRTSVFVILLASTTRAFGWGVQERRAFLQTVPLSWLANLSPESANAILSSENCDNGIGYGCDGDKDYNDDEDSEKDDSDDDGSDDDADSASDSDSSDDDSG
jgi:hypothetical protein